MFRAAVITVSDSCSLGRRDDLSGAAVADLLSANGFRVVARTVTPDERPQIERVLREQCAQARLVITTGGTGIAPRDVTPEAIRAVCDRILEGFGELMRAEGRAHTPLAALSRSLGGTLGTSLIIALPGSVRGAVESLVPVLPLIPHALALLDGSAKHELQIE